MAKILKIEERTREFVKALAAMKEAGEAPTNAELASILNINSVSTISEIKALRQNIQPETWEKFRKKYASYISEESVSPETLASGNSESYLSKRRKLKQAKTDPFMVPLVPVKAQAGYVRAYDQETYVDTLEKYALPPGVNPQGAIWRYWEIEGESMEPAFHNKDIILTSQVHQFDSENLRNFYLYVIVTPEKVLFKRIFCKNALEWVLISENEEFYEQQLLPLEFVKEVWVYRRSIVSKAPPTKMFEIKV